MKPHSVKCVGVDFNKIKFVDKTIVVSSTFKGSCIKHLTFHILLVVWYLLSFPHFVLVKT